VIYYHLVIHADYSPHIASLPRHNGLLRKNMSHLSRIFSTPLRRELCRPPSKWINCRFEYSRFMVRNANRKGGFVYLRVSRVSCFMPLSLTMINGLSAGITRGYVSSFTHDKRDQLVVDAARRITCYFRSSRQLGLVLADLSHTIFDRCSRVQC